MNFTLKELFEHVPEGFADMEFPSHLATDSREVTSGDAFIALEGEKTDGHKYIPQAIENGAVLLIVRKGKAPEDVNIPVIELDEPERDLALIASKKLRAHELHDIIAITGSVGKTTTRAALQLVLYEKFRVHATERNMNTLIGCAAAIMAMPKETEILILEFGTNKPGEIRELSEYFPPTIAILTAIAPAHLEGLKTVEGVLEEKLEITRPSSIDKIIFNNDNQYLSEAFKYIVKSMGVGEARDSDFVLSIDNSEYTLPALSFVLALRQTQEIARYTANIWGRHNAMPLALAAAAGHELGISLQESSEALSNFEAIYGRGKIIMRDDGRFIVDDSYNANPASMRASLQTFARIKASGKIAVLGEMRELGEDSVKYHAELKPLLEDIDDVILVGNIWHEALDNHSGFTFVSDWKEGLVCVKKIMETDSWSGILIKGSNSIGLSNIVKELS